MATCLSKQTLKFLKQQLHILHSDLDFFKKEAENICVKIANDEENIHCLTEKKNAIENNILNVQQHLQPLLEKQRLQQKKVEKSTGKKRKRDEDEDTLCNVQVNLHNLECKHHALLIEIKMLMRLHLAKITQKQYIFAKLQTAKDEVCKCKAEINRCEEANMNLLT